MSLDSSKFLEYNAVLIGPPLTNPNSSEYFLKPFSADVDPNTQVLVGRIPRRRDSYWIFELFGNKKLGSTFRYHGALNYGYKSNIIIPFGQDGPIYNQDLSELDQDNDVLPYAVILYDSNTNELKLFLREFLTLNGNLDKILKGSEKLFDLIHSNYNLSTSDSYH